MGLHFTVTALNESSVCVCVCVQPVGLLRKAFEER